MAVFIVLLIVKLALFVIVSGYEAIYDDGVTDGTELVFAFVVHRHGERAPVQEEVFNDTETVDRLVTPWGYDQLTFAGMRTGFDVGKFIRRRYDALLSRRYKRSEIYIRATDSTRAKMTALTAMAAVYRPLEENWRDDINWVPVPYTTVPDESDFNLPFLNCPAYITAYNVTVNQPSPKMDKYASLFKKLSDRGEDISSNPLIIYDVHDAYTSEINVGMKLGEDIMSMMPEILEASDEAADILYGNKELLPLQAGVLMQEFLDKAALIIAGNETQKVRVYSAHDFNVYSMAAISQITPRQGTPKYGAIFSLELRRVIETGKYVVLPVYARTPKDPEIYLPVDGCDGILCDFYKFIDITQNYTLTYEEWRTKCEWTPGWKMDESLVY